MSPKSSSETYLETAYLEATEWNMATLEELCSIKSSSKHRIDRQKSICTKMLVICASLKDAQLPRHGHATRSTKILESAKETGMPISHLVAEYADRVRNF